MLRVFLQQSLCGCSQGVRIDLKVDLHARLRVHAPVALLALDLAALQVLYSPHICKAVHIMLKITVSADIQPSHAVGTLRSAGCLGPAGGCAASSGVHLAAAR